MKFEDKPADYFDTKVPGLNLRVGQSKKTWFFVYTSPKSKQRARICIGTYPATELADARTKAIEYRGLVESGADPRDEKREVKSESGVMTFAMLAENYYRQHASTALWPQLSIMKKPFELALKLALVTGQRIGEVVGMTEEELDLKKAVWTIPAERSKNAKAHTVPLSNMALDLIAQTKMQGRLFDRTPEAVAEMLAYHLHKLPVQGWRAHDLRRTVCTHLAMLGYQPLIIGAVVNHTAVVKSGVTSQVYIKYDYAAEKRQALDAWAERLSAIVSGDAAKVIPLRQA